MGGDGDWRGATFSNRDKPAEHNAMEGDEEVARLGACLPRVTAVSSAARKRSQSQSGNGVSA